MKRLTHHFATGETSFLAIRTSNADLSIVVLSHLEDPCLHLLLDEAMFVLGDAEGLLQDLKAVGMVH